MIKLIEIKPNFYDEFKCINSKCTDSCCIGWEIDIDDVTNEKYTSDTSEFGKEIVSNIVVSEDGSRCFKLCENERCPFLDENNLCKIIKNYSEEMLSDICREHPRFYNDFVCATECGLGLCCEEACRLLLEADGFSLNESGFICEAEIETEDDKLEYEAYVEMSALRNTIFEILDKEIAYEEKLNEIFALKPLEVEIYDLKMMVKAYKSTEPINDEWSSFIECMYENLDTYLENATAFLKLPENDKLYSKILSYLLFRHLSSAVFDGMLNERIAFCVESVAFIGLCDLKIFTEKGKVEFLDRVNNLKNWSKQIEYSQENLDALMRK